MPPTLRRRALGFASVCSFFAVATILLLADRSSSLVERVRLLVVTAGQRAERVLDIDVLDRSDLPGTFDQVGHAVLWGAGMLVVGAAVRRQIPVAVTALFMAGLSLAFEVAQPLLSTTRALEPSDALGNLVGIALAAVLLAIAQLVRRSWRLRTVAA